MSSDIITTTKHSMLQRLIIKSIILMLFILCLYFVIDLSMTESQQLITVNVDTYTQNKYDFYTEYQQQNERDVIQIESNLPSMVLDITVLNGWQSEKIDAAKLIWQMFAIDNKYDPLFVCGIIGNMYGEGSFGLIEGSFVHQFKSCNLVPLSYSSRLGDINAARTVCSYDSYISCGLGAIQWSFTRRAGLLPYYENEYKKSGEFGIIELSRAELNYMLYELQGSYSYVYERWLNIKSQCENIEDCIMRAVGAVLLKYEAPYGSDVVSDKTFIVPDDSHFYSDRYLPALQFYKAIGGELS